MAQSGAFVDASRSLNELSRALAVLESENSSLRGAVDRLASENAKLRELVQDMWFWHYEGYIDSESPERQMSHIDGVIDRMRELGAEVNYD